MTLSSGEAELVAAVKVSSGMLGAIQLMEDWGIKSTGQVFVDSFAALKKRSEEKETADSGT